MKTYFIGSSFEKDRNINFDKLHNIPFLNIEYIEAIYPNKIHVPFIDKLIKKSGQQTGVNLLIGEVGCLLSHRKIWRLIEKELDKTQHFLILESDCLINNSDFLFQYFEQMQLSYDIFFWGSWEGHTKLFRSSIANLEGNYKSGTAFIKTVYCTYGYSLNARAASLLLDRTRKISYPVDQFKRFLRQSELKIGAVIPEVISGNKMGSTIRPKKNGYLDFLFLLILDIKNQLICYFK